MLEVSPKQYEAYEIILNCIKMNGYQPNYKEIGDLLGIEVPAARSRVAQLIEKGLLNAPPPKAERCLGIANVKFAAYQVDDDGVPVEQTIDLGGFTLTIKRSES